MKVAFMTLMIPWYVAALGAAVVWGIHYPLIDFALKRISLMTVLLLTAIPVLLLVPCFRHVLVADARVLAQLGTGERWTVLSIAVSSLVATVLLFISIDRKNATLAGLIEITYPLVIIFFTWLLFREVNLNWTSAFGGLLIMAGAVIVIASSR
jgi:drug/metabolite transporter (DMT)-like permease